MDVFWRRLGRKASLRSEQFHCQAAALACVIQCSLAWSSRWGDCQKDTNAVVPEGPHNNRNVAGETVECLSLASDKEIE